MKNFITAAIFILSAFQLKAQINIEDDNTILSSELTAINYMPKDVILKMFYSVKKFGTGKQGIEFSFIIKPKKDMPKVNLDSIILRSIDYKILPIHKTYFDTTYSLMDISLSYNTVHLLDDAAIKFLKEEMISDITIFVDHSPITIRIDKKSQKKMNQIMKSNL
jgi:hypothetical protein